jgi:hypothetical protein
VTYAAGVGAPWASEPASVRPVAAEEPEASAGAALLADVIEPCEAARVALTSGRTVEIESGGERDRIVVRAPRGEVVLRIEVTDAGPVLSFSSAEIELHSAGALRLDAATIEIASRGDVSIDAAGSLRQHVGGHLHTRVGADARLEAANVELLADDGHVDVLAIERVRLDGEHIGLNDNPAPRPFPWSRAARDEDA